MKVLILYTELAEYFIKCCEELSKQAEVHIVRWPVNKEAPFKFKFPEQLNIYNKENYTEEELLALAITIQPDIVVCSGWIDRLYLKITRRFFGKIPTVMTCDTWWRGNPKQWLAAILGKLFLQRIFSHAWVPGEIQKKYALHLGFKASCIIKGFYSCDLDHFNHLYEKRKAILSSNFPKRFIYIGRYYDFKGLPELWEAFVELKKEEGNEWELWCIGTGSLESKTHPDIKHFGFVQPDQLETYLNQSSVFILPSRFEPWAVVVHEMAAAGFPLLLSSEVGAAETFLREPENGYRFAAGNSKKIKEAMKKIIHLEVNELMKMSEESHRLAQQITPRIWADSLVRIQYGNKN